MIKASVYQFDFAWLPSGWAENVLVEVDSQGVIAAIGDTIHGPAERIKGAAIPGMFNCHSHAFQRGIVGQTEYRGSALENFWSWRERMYNLALRLSPDALREIATQLYIEMLKAGYTSVCEFHYLHHGPDGKSYDDPAIMSQALIDAAAEAGIALTLLPTLYMASGFGGLPPADHQRRFIWNPDGLARLISDLQARTALNPTVTIGLALHSLRAVPPDALRAMLAALPSDPQTPIHIHISEQIQEVKDCLVWSGRRPVEWLLDHCDVGPAWCLVHATHLLPSETSAMARSGAIAGLCPTTEANLGDGLFPLPSYLDEGGRFAIGSDSHISVCPREELRWLEYGQRLIRQQRNVSATAAEPHTGARLWAGALSGGAHAANRKAGALAIGRHADLLVLDLETAALFGLKPESLIDGCIFAGYSSPIRDVMVGGIWRIQNQAHSGESGALSRFRRVMADLSAG